MTPLFHLILIHHDPSMTSCQVLEESWHHLQAAVRDARGFDDVLHAHDEFLERVMERMFLLPTSQVCKCATCACAITHTLCAECAFAAALDV